MNTALKIKHLHKPESGKRRKELRVFVAGIGAVGSTLIRQIREIRHHNYDLRLIGYCNSSHTVWDPEDFSKPDDSAESTDWDLIPKKLIKRNDTDLIFVDATGSKEVALSYDVLLKAGIKVVTPSKIANTLEQEYFNRLIKLSGREGRKYRYETTVGAGLPIIQTLNNLINSGDRIQKVTGVVSGTMTYLFNRIENGASFSEAILDARDLGYSEPDPRDDLSGTDVARKFLIVARTCGHHFELDQITVDSLVPEALIDHDLEDFVAEIPDYDGHWKSRSSQALVNNRKLRYTGTFTPEGIRVGVEEVRSDSPLALLKGTDNLIQIYTDRYSEYPIVIQGPGAGKEVTAAGILSEIVL